MQVSGIICGYIKDSEDNKEIEDNTLIPSRIRKVIQQQLDIFDILSSSLLKTLQFSITKAIDTIKNQKKPIIIAVVSNASMKWLNQLLKYSQDQRQIFPFLGKYLKQNNIAMFSAMDEMHNFLQYKFDANIASEMMQHAYTNYSHDSDEQQKWMWKYTTFSFILLQYKRFRNRNCNHIISVGDGSTEAKALQTYVKKFNIKCTHIKFLDSPTINQLQLQWKYIEDKFSEMISISENTATNRFELFNLRQIFKCDNNKKCTGQTNQIHAVVNYIELWINGWDVNEENSINKLAAFAQNKLTNTAKQNIYK